MATPGMFMGVRGWVKKLVRAQSGAGFSMLIGCLPNIGTRKGSSFFLLWSAVPLQNLLLIKPNIKPVSKRGMFVRSSSSIIKQSKKRWI